MTKHTKPTHEQIIDSAEKFYRQRVTADRQFIITRSVSCIRDHPHDEHYRIDYTSKVWCPLAHEGKPHGSLFWCDCPCHTIAT